MTSILTDSTTILTDDNPNQSNSTQAQLLHQQQQYLQQLRGLQQTPGLHPGQPEHQGQASLSSLHTLLALAEHPEVRWWLNRQAPSLCVQVLAERLTTAKLQQLFSNQALFRQLNHPNAARLSPLVLLRILIHPELQPLFTGSATLFEAQPLITAIAEQDWRPPAALTQLLTQSKVMTALLKRPSFCQFFKEAEFFNLLNNPVFLQVLTTTDMLKHLQDPKVCQGFQPQHWFKLLEQPAFNRLVENPAFTALFQYPAFTQWFAQPGIVAFFNTPEIINRFNNQDFLNRLNLAQTVSALQKVHASSPTLSLSLPKILPTQAPKLAFYYCSTFNTNFADPQRQAMQKKFSLTTDSSDPSTLQQSLTQGQFNTLVIPLNSQDSIANPNHYRDFVALGGRIISNSHTWNLTLINALFDWGLQFKNNHTSGTLVGSQLHVSTPLIQNRTYTTERSSLPSNAQAFLHHSEYTNQVAGAYIPYGFGEVILIGYDWESGSDTEWDALLHGLIDGTALPYQRRYVAES